MPALNRYPTRGFPFLRSIGKLGTLFLAIGMMACGGGGRLTTDRAYSELKPKEQLPEREMRQLPENLLIHIENVADAGRSYRNYVVLFVNGREVAPIEKLNNFASKYTYPLRLQHGVYEVRAEYHVVGFWREQVFDIVTDEPVKVLPEQKTMLSVRLDKDHRGRPVQQPVRFRLQYEALNDVTAPLTSVRREAQTDVPAPLVEEITSKEPVIWAPQPEREARPVRIIRPRQPIPSLPEQTPLPSAGTLTLQINTSPSGADIILDDRYLGQSPLKVTVTANQSHVLQISRAGHQEVVKVIDAKELQGQNLLQYLIKLEPVQQR
jgi:hypothetical protein